MTIEEFYEEVRKLANGRPCHANVKIGSYTRDEYEYSAWVKLPKLHCGAAGSNEDPEAVLTELAALIYRAELSTQSTQEPK